MSDVLVLFSGGQDSTTCLAIAKSQYHRVEAVCFQYGQRHDIEIAQARVIADIAEIPLTMVDLSFIATLSQNALTSRCIEIQSTDRLPTTFVPGRNILFLTIASIIATEKNISTIMGGMCETDYSGYPDCRQAFIQSMAQSLGLGLDVPIEIQTPLMHLTKSDTVRLMAQLGRLDWYAHTHTCYEGVRPACGKCPACILRLKGFHEAGISDPLAYAIPPIP